MKKYLQGKRLLVTGGTGSFGKMFIKEILKYDVKEVIVYSRDENKQGAMKAEFVGAPLRYILGDIRDYHSTREAMRGVDIVIHAAALKWITEVEFNVWEGIKTNVIGAQNIIEAARDMNVEKVVALSTDKAVDPINAYGMAKALQERLITTANLYDNGTRTTFVSTRYGNVLGSRGSVVPFFKSLLDQDKPLTVTDPSMTRYIMTLQDSVELVLKALIEGVGGEVFVKKMPAHSVGDLVEVMLENLPKEKRKEYVTIGVRPGEKIHEALVSRAEAPRTIELEDYYVILPQIPLSTIEKKYGRNPRLGDFYYASNTAYRLSKNELHAILKKEGFL